MRHKQLDVTANKTLNRLHAHPFHCTRMLQPGRQISQLCRQFASSADDCHHASTMDETGRPDRGRSHGLGRVSKRGQKRRLCHRNIDDCIHMHFHDNPRDTQHHSAAHTCEVSLSSTPLRKPLRYCAEYV